MKISVLVVVVLATLVSFPALAQDQASCKAYFQVLQADAGMPGLHTGLNSAQKKWWDSNGQKKYPGLCLSGAIRSGRQAPVSGDLVEVHIDRSDLPGPHGSVRAKRRRLASDGSHDADLPTALGFSLGHNCKCLN